MPSLPRSHRIVGRWVPSAGATGYRLVDRVRSNHGTLTNMDAASDWVASGGRIALDFDGTNDHVNCGNRVPRLGNGHTFAAWVLKRANGGMIAGMCDSIPSGGIEWSDTGGNFAFAFFDGSIRGWFTGPAIPSNQWSFVCAAFSNTSQRLIVNKTATTTSVSTSGIVYANDAWRIGIASIGNPTWNGQIDDVILWDRFLTDAEINTVYRLGRGYGVFPEPDFDEGFAAAGFKAYWARRQSQLIGGGL